MVLQELESVSDVKSHFVAVEALGHVWQIESRHLGNIFVDLALDDLLDQGMLGTLTSNAAISAANDQDTLRVGVAVQWQECDHFLVGVLVQFSALNATVKNEHVSKLLARFFFGSFFQICCAEFYFNTRTTEIAFNSND